MPSDANLDEPITVTVTPTRGDFVSFNMWFALGRSRALLPVGIPCLAVALYVFYLAPKFAQGRGVDPNTYLFAGLFVCAAMAVCIPLGVYLGAVRRWSAAAELREPRRYTFTDGGVQVAGDTYAAFTAWSHIVRAGRIGGQVYLGTNQNQFHLIPAAAFGEQWDRFRVLVVERVKGCRL